MEVYNFSDDDLEVLCENEISVVTWAEIREEASLFERVPNKARGARSEVRQLAESVQNYEDKMA